MIAHARRTAPTECCGFLVGRGRAVISTVEMDNVAGSPTEFQIDAAEHIELRRLLRRARPPLTILGVYHSHPGSEAYPSETDVAQCFYPDWVQVIVSLATQPPIVRGFRIAAGQVEAVALR
jgi:proteasome lid subunit RPN8/RPN11